MKNKPGTMNTLPQPHTECRRCTTQQHLHINLNPKQAQLNPKNYHAKYV